MRRGDFARAWAVSDEVLRQRLASGQTCAQWPRHLQYIWDGRALAGKRVLVRCYHGLGDTIQFIRFAAPLRAVAGEVLVWAQAELLPLIRTAAGVDRVLPLHDGAPDVEYDADLEIMEIPHALRVTPQSIPQNVPYLFPPSLPRLPGALSPENAASIGIVWQAGDWNPQRSIPATLLQPLASVPNVRLLSLQRGRAQADATSIPAADISCHDVTELAAILRALDLVISVDTMTAHLAGALGVPVWTLLHAYCDWRWMETGSHTVWYPTMRLFRQPRPDDWASVIEEVRRTLWEGFSSLRTPETERNVG